MIIKFKKYIIIIDSKLTYRKQGFFLVSLATILRSDFFFVFFLLYLFFILFLIVFVPNNCMNVVVGFFFHMRSIFS